MQRQREIDLSGKVAIVTGASRGIGKQTALALARRGVDVVVAARSVGAGGPLPGTILETVEEIDATGARALAVATDLAAEADLDRLVDSAVERFGGVDLLINNAAATARVVVPIDELEPHEWHYQFAVNVHAPFRLIRRLLPIMEARGAGRILNLSAGRPAVSPSAPPPDAIGGMPAYLASKKALDQLSAEIAPELARKNIYVISVHPGFVATEMAGRVTGGNLGGAIPMAIPARVLEYFAACQNPIEYSGRVFRAETALAELGLALDETTAAT